MDRGTIHELAQVISQCYDAKTGKVKIPGFYDDVAPASKAEVNNFVNSGFTERLKGLRRAESDALLDMLFVHVQKPEYQVRWTWKENAIAFWDNRITQHYAVNDYLPHRRIMNRATILGDRPFHRTRKPVAAKAAAE